MSFSGPVGSLDGPGSGPGPGRNAECEDDVAPQLVDGLGIFFGWIVSPGGAVACDCDPPWEVVVPDVLCPPLGSSCAHDGSSSFHAGFGWSSPITDLQWHIPKVEVVKIAASSALSFSQCSDEVPDLIVASMALLLLGVSCTFIGD